MEIVKAGPKDISLINVLASQAWGPTYKNILSAEQLDYMFDMMYSHESINVQLAERGHQFLLAKEDNEHFGFASYELHYKPGTTKIHKLYVLPGNQGAGIGLTLLKAIEKEALNNNNSCITLNVNRFNPALHFYTKAGFSKTGEEDIHIGQGFLMEDYIMEKGLHTL